MVQLETNTAIELVRKNMEELDPNGSIMYDDENGSADAFSDNPSLDDIIRRNLPEAINAVHRVAPVQLLEGREHDFADGGTVSVSEDGIITVELGEDSKMIRLVAFQASDSPIVLTDVLSEASPEGRKQLNPYIRGRADRPRLVLSQGRYTGPVIKYYSLTDASPYAEDPAGAISRLSYVEEQFYDGQTQSYPVSRMLRQNIIDKLTAQVLQTYGDQRATIFETKANTF